MVRSGAPLAHGAGEETGADFAAGLLDAHGAAAVCAGACATLFARTLGEGDASSGIKAAATTKAKVINARLLAM